MDESSERGLQITELRRMLPKEFGTLSTEEQRSVLKRLIESQIDIAAEYRRKVGQSEIAQRDLEDLIDQVQRLEKDRKVYSVGGEYTTGSGSSTIRIRGGDIRFIVPILVVVGVVILGIVVILALR